MATKAILEIYNSKTDINGNRYFAFMFEWCETGEYVYATSTGGASNIEQISRYMGLDVNEVHRYNIELGIREFNSFVKQFEHAGSQPQEIASFIKKELNLK